MLKTLETPETKHSSGAHACPACAAHGVVDVFRGPQLPVDVGAFHVTPDEAVSAPRGGVTLSYCPACGLIFNRSFDPDLDVFKPGYEVALHHSETFRRFIESVARRLVNRFELRGKRIVEIGCGDAYFLKRLAELGGNECIGIDPTIVREGEFETASGRVTLIRDYFGPAHQGHEADFVCCLSVFEDIPRPGPFLQAAYALASRRDAPLYFEVFNGWRALEAQEVWSVNYEQCNYFSLDSLQSIFARNGFSVEAASTCYEGDQYIFVEARPGEKQVADPAVAEDRTVPGALLAFGEAFRKKLAWWNAELAQARRGGERVVVWGTGAKGITFLNALDDPEAIQFVAEINPDKQGKYVPGTGQKIVPPEFLAEYRPHKVIITNALYEDEMREQARAMGLETGFLIA
ncbi:MAG: methyltransferase domain-containing protein [Pseudomonadota bacterium]